MKRNFHKQIIAIFTILFMLVTSNFSYTGVSKVSEASAINVNWVTGLADTSVSLARAYIDASGRIYSRDTITTNTTFNNSKMNSIDGYLNTHTDLPGGWEKSNADLRTLGIMYDLGSVKDISQIKVFGITSATHYLSGVRIFISQTGNDWINKTAVLVDEVSNTVGKYEFGGNLDKTYSARYVMVIVTDYVTTTGQPRVAEVQVIGPQPDGPAPTNFSTTLTNDSITPIRTYLNTSGNISNTGTFSNSTFNTTKLNMIDGRYDTHCDIPGGYGKTNGFETLGTVFDLGESKNLSAIKVYGIGNATHYISGIRVFVSETGTDWIGKSGVIVDETNDNIGKVQFGGQLQQIVSARYVMVIPTSYVSTTGQPRIAEVEIFGTDKAAPTFAIENIFNNLKLNGRTTIYQGNLANGLDIDWSGAGISFNMTATKTTDVTFNFSMLSRSSVDPSVYFTVYVDGVKLNDKRYGIKASAAEVRENLSFSIKDIPVGNHTIEIYKQTENKSGECTLLSIAMNGTFGAKPVDKPIKMEVIGDSVIAGYGNLGTKSINTDSIGSSPLYQDAQQTFSAIVANQLNADISILGMSGIAIACGSPTTPHYYIMPDYYPYANYARYKPQHHAGSWINWNFGSGADYVIINLGANDWNRHKTVVNGVEVWDENSACGVSYEEVGQYMMTFLRTVREKNPNAQIIWTYGMTGFACRDKVRMAVDYARLAGDNKVSYLDLEAGNDGVDGANGHPSVAEHQIGAAKLLAHINDLNNPPAIPVRTPDEPTKLSSFTLSVSEGGTVDLSKDGNTTSIATNVNTEYPRGSSVTLNAIPNEGYKFSYWINQSTGAILSYHASYVCNVGTGANIRAVFTRIPTEATTEYTVIFKDKTGRVLQTSTVSKGQAATPPSNPSLFGHVFIGWDKDFSNVTSDMVINAVYEKAVVTYDVNVTDGKLSSGETSGSYQFDAAVTVIANDAPLGKKFSHWEQDGQKVSINSTYTFYMPMRTTNLRAIYVLAVHTVDTRPFITLSSGAMIDNSNNSIAFTASRTVPSGYTLIESGIMFLQSSTVPTELTLDTPGVLKGRARSTSTDQFNIRLLNVTIGQTWYAKAYLIYEDTEGNIFTVYSSNMESATLN